LGRSLSTLKGTKMAHKVTFTTPALELGNADIELKVRRNGAVIGTMKISRGNLVWVPRDEQIGYKIGWQKFDQFMQTEGKKDR